MAKRVIRKGAFLNRMAFEQAPTHRLALLLAEVLPKSIKHRGVKAAVAAAGKVITKEAKRNMPVETGLLRVSIGQRTVSRPKKGTAATIIGARTRFKSVKRDRLQGRKKKRRPSKYLHLVEFGTKPHVIPFTFVFDAEGEKIPIDQAQHPGTKPLTPLTRAVRNTKGAQAKAMVGAIRKTIAKAVRKKLTGSSRRKAKAS